MFKTLALGALATFANADTLGSSAIDPGPFVNETWYSGLVQIDRNATTNAFNDDIFYWWFESRDNATADPLVLWLTGGPGCASEIALFYENGPYKFNDDGKTLRGNPASWNDHANLLYVDQPIGTGFSHSAIIDHDTNED